MESEIIKCLNCGSGLNPDHTFCGNCGQNRKESKLSVGKVLGDALSNLFNIDNRFFHTLKDIHRPSKLTNTYVAGKRKYYMNPAKLFLFSLIALISITLLNMEISDVDELSEGMIKEVAIAEQKTLWDSMVSEIKTPENEIALKKLEDTLYHGLNIDSLYLGDKGNLDMFGYNIKDYKIKKQDAVRLTPDEIVKKYNITDFRAKIFTKQYLKTMTNTSEGIKYIVKNLTWVILILLFFMASIMKMLYWKKNYYYVEHLVLLLYSHSFAFILFMIVLLASWIFGDNNILGIGLSSVSILLIVVQYLTLKKYYNQGWFATLLSMSIINFTYLTLGSTILIFGTIASFILF